VSVIVPESVALGMQIDAELERRKRLVDRHGHLRQLERELQRLDPNLSLVKASEHPSQSALTPGAWHVRRDNQGTMPSYIPILDDDGRPREPTMLEVHRLQQGDMQRPGYFEDLRRQQERRRAGIEAEKRLASLDRQEHIKDVYNTLERPQAGYAKKWTNSTRGKRAR